MTSERSAPERVWISAEHWQPFGAKPSDTALPYCVEYVRADIPAAALDAEREKNAELHADNEIKAFKIERLTKELSIERETRARRWKALQALLAERDTARADAEMLRLALQEINMKDTYCNSVGVVAGQFALIARAALNPQPTKGAEE